MKIIIGVTGGFGTGKSTVAKMLKSEMPDSVILDADKIAKSVMKREEIKERIKKEFGTNDKKKIAEIVFSNKDKLNKLNRIVHPVVIKEIKNKIRININKAIILDIPLLFEAGMEKICDVTVAVKCKKSEQIKRLVKKGFSRHEIIKRINSQMKTSEKAKKSGYVIDNSGNTQDTKRQLMKIMKIIKIMDMVKT